MNEMQYTLPLYNCSIVKFLAVEYMISRKYVQYNDKISIYCSSFQQPLVFMTSHLGNENGSRQHGQQHLASQHRKDMS